VNDIPETPWRCRAAMVASIIRVRVSCGISLLGPAPVLLSGLD
jgi:hypothetical protein